MSLHLMLPSLRSSSFCPPSFCPISSETESEKSGQKNVSHVSPSCLTFKTRHAAATPFLTAWLRPRVTDEPPSDASISPLFIFLPPIFLPDLLRNRVRKIGAEKCFSRFTFPPYVQNSACSSYTFLNCM